MPLRENYSGLPETLQERVQAAQGRYAEGIELIRRGYPWTGLYLLGFCAEMILKNAYFHLKGARKIYSIRGELVQAQKEAKSLGVQFSPEGFHNLEFWSNLLVLQGQNEGIDRLFERELLARSRRMNQSWWPGMRYRAGNPPKNEVKWLTQDAAWFVANHGNIGRR